jgi:hypothetical protein
MKYNKIFVVCLSLCYFLCGCSARKVPNDQVFLQAVEATYQLKNEPGINQVDFRKVTNSYAALLASPGEYDESETYYDLYCNKLDCGDLYSMYYARMCCGANFMYGGEFMVDCFTHLKGKGNGVFGENMLFAAKHLEMGESTLFVFVPHKDTRVLTGVLCPKPIEFEWEDKAYVRLGIGKSPMNWQFIVAGRGFKPDEEIRIITNGHSSDIAMTMKADASGYCFFILPTAYEKQSGHAKLQVKRLLDEKAASLEYTWGTPSRL